jgi:hypothetical protein
MAKRKRDLPAFLNGRVTRETYERWLTRKAAAHAKRDRKRKHSDVTEAGYRDAIHEAVMLSAGKDSYKSEDLAWHLISQYDNDSAKSGRHHYKANFALLPTVDHFEASSTSAEFRICAWRTNDAKNDLPIETFQDLCARVLRHAGFRIERN